MEHFENTMVHRMKWRNPFRVTRLPVLARIYRYPYTQWQSVHRLQAFGFPWLITYALLRKISPFPSIGTCELQLSDRKVTLSFDARNTQFQALYLPTFSLGYEPEVMAMLDVLLPDDGVFYDIGSNFGYFSVYAASRPGFRGHIQAFEPYAPTHKDLLSFVQQATLQDRIACQACALSDYDGAGTMKLPDFTHSGLASLESGGAGGGGVKVARLDSLGLLPPSVMKVDAEGSEASILAGALNVIKQHRPYIIFESWCNHAEPKQTLEPWRILKQCEYAFFQPCWLRECDGIPPFLSSEHSKGGGDPLALIPISPRDRFIQSNQLNVLACPKDRESELRQKFSTV